MDIEIKTKFTLNAIEIKEALLHIFKQQTGLDLIHTNSDKIEFDVFIDEEGNVIEDQLKAILSVDNNTTK